MSLYDLPLARPDRGSALKVRENNKSKASSVKSTKRSKKSGASSSSNDIKPLMRALGKLGDVDKVFVVMDQKSRVWEIRCQDDMD